MAKTKKGKLTIEDALVPVEEQPYGIPENWCWTYLLTGAAECKDGFRKPINSSERADREGDIPYYGATGQVGWIDDYLTDEQLVLLGEDGAPFLDLMKDKAYIIEGKAWVNNHAHILKSYYGEIGNKYLLHYLNTFNYHGYVNGTTRLKLTQASMNTIPVPIPPLAEQKRIVEQIENLFSKLDEAREKAQEALDSFEIRKRSILYNAFVGNYSQGDDISEVEYLFSEITRVKDDMISKKIIQKAKVIPVQDCDMKMEFPDRWKQVKLGEIAFVTKLAGFEYTKYFNLEETGEVPVIRAQNVRSGYLDTRNLLYIDRETSESLQRSALTKPSILVTFIGAGIGDVCVFDEKTRFHLAPNVAKVEPYVDESTDININYILLYLLSSFGQYEIFKNMKATAQPSLSMETIRDIIVPIPTLEEQNQIVETVNKILDKENDAKELAEQIVSKIDTMKKSILAKAFRGELGTNDLTEESSIELLKSILEK